jgi:hypothetical protein
MNDEIGMIAILVLAACVVWLFGKVNKLNERLEDLEWHRKTFEKDICDAFDSLRSPPPEQPH